jgi:hypothetical protein
MSEDRKPDRRAQERLPIEMLRQVTAAHVQAAVRQLLDGVGHPFGPSTDFDLITGAGELLPPKAVFGLAATEALGFPVLPKHFTGGVGTPCFQALEAAGFAIRPKASLASDGLGPAKVSRAVSTQAGFTNRNGQIVVGPTGRPGTDHGQSIYVLRCTTCSEVYGANGSDIALRRCPNCGGGRPGFGVSEADVLRSEEAPSEPQDGLESFAVEHRKALRWFNANAGREVTWADILDGTGLPVTTQKGIYKPASWRHALSIRQALGTSYDDRPLELLGDEKWALEYFQEGADPAHVDQYFTNRALKACLEDGVPVGVIAQIHRKPAKYRIEGLAWVTSYRDGFFRLEGGRPGQSPWPADADPAARDLPNGSDVHAVEVMDLVTRTSRSGPGSSRSGYRKSTKAKEVGDWAEQQVLRFLQHLGGCAEIVHRAAQGETPGWDIDYRDPAGVLHRVEVKGSVGNTFTTVDLTANELRAAREHADAYWIVLVANCLTNRPRIQRICNPAAALDAGEWTATPALYSVRLG